MWLESSQEFNMIGDDNWQGGTLKKEIRQIISRTHAFLLMGFQGWEHVDLQVLLSYNSDKSQSDNPVGTSLSIFKELKFQKLKFWR